ncbi:hypothetical protein HPB50_021426 [Hyalomma asiaticum]|uniref:Uncharacterized protein n=1 Tax=Hyalomma asiaticum TaxID=266040 RepID=A0ACB7TNI1_HYAAI|nr:hypothetical protein HPB50_021426 [Hyalomma asiaticum]
MSARNCTWENRARKELRKFVGRSTVEALKKTNGKRSTQAREEKEKRCLERAESRTHWEIRERRGWRRVTVVSGSGPERERSNKAKVLQLSPMNSEVHWVLASWVTSPDLSRLWRAGLPVWLSLLGMSLCDASSGPSHPPQILSGTYVLAGMLAQLRR